MIRSSGVDSNSRAHAIRCRVSHAWSLEALGGPLPRSAQWPRKGTREGRHPRLAERAHPL